MRAAISIAIVLCLLITALPIVAQEKADTAGSVVAPGSRGNTLYVGAGQTYTKIQDAVDAASAGDTVFVYGGTYSENIGIYKTLTIIGNGSIVTDVIGSPNYAFKITANRVNLSGFDIQNHNGGLLGYGGIYLFKVQNCRIENNSISDFSTGIGFSFSSNNLLYNNTILNGMVGFNLGFSSEYNIFSNNTFSGNDQGISFFSSGYNTLKGNTFIKTGLQFWLSGDGLNYWNTHIIDTTNTVNGKPIQYRKNASGETIPPGAGQIILANCTSMVIKDQNVSGGRAGIILGRSSNNQIFNNIASSNREGGIYIQDSSDNNIIFDNTVNANEEWGIIIQISSSNTINNNTVNNNCEGMYLIESDKDKISKNSIISNFNGIYLWQSSNNELSNNTIGLANNTGIYDEGSSNNLIVDNTIYNNTRCGLNIHSYSDYISNNVMKDNGIFIQGDSQNQWTTHAISTSNTVNGKPVHYWKNLTGGTVPSGAGQVILANCQNVTVSDQNVSDGSVGILLGFSNWNTIVNNTANSNTLGGIYLNFSCNNTLSNNTVSTNSFSGIVLFHSSSDNIVKNNTLSSNNYGMEIKYLCSNNNIFHNNFLNNVNQAYNGHIVNSWDNGVEGNYWSDWTSPDANGDGIIDLPYNISGSAGAKDNFPLTHPYNDTLPIPKQNGRVLNTRTAKLYTQIQTAIDEANPGDEIHIYSGIYSENINITKQLILKGNGTDQTVILPPISNTGINLDADHSTLSDMCINISMVRNGISIYKNKLFLENLSFTNGNGYLFTLSPDCRDDIIYYGLEINDTIRNAFKAHGYLLSDWPIGIQINDHTWNIQDETTLYLIEDDGQGMKVYKKNSGIGINFASAAFIRINQCEFDNIPTCFFILNSNNLSFENISADSDIYIDSSDFITLDQILLSDNTNDFRTARIFIRNSSSVAITNTNIQIGNQDPYGNGNCSIELIDSSYCRILTCELNESEIGILIHGNSLYNYIQYNTIKFMDYGAINIISNNCRYNLVSNNNILNSYGYQGGPGWRGSPGFDDGKYNSWDDGSRGNYWSNWVSPDDNGDGIVDIPYNINGSADSKDNYPLTNPNGIIIEDRISPYVLWVFPTDITVDEVPVTTSGFIINFSEPMNVESLKSSISLEPTATHFSLMEYDPSMKTITIEFSSELKFNTTYFINVSTEAKDKVGNHLAYPFSFSFTTEGSTNPQPDDDDDITNTTDSDLDSLPDSWEDKYFSNLTYGPDNDPDGDGLTNLEEYNLGSDPTDPDSPGEEPSESPLARLWGDIWVYFLIALLVITTMCIVFILVIRRKRAQSSETEDKSRIQTSEAEAGHDEKQSPVSEPEMKKDLMPMHEIAPDMPEPETKIEVVDPEGQRELILLELREEALDPSQPFTSEEKALTALKEKLDSGKISKETYDSIMKEIAQDKDKG